MVKGKTSRQIDKIFDNHARSLYSKFAGSSKLIYDEIFPEAVKTRVKDGKNGMIEMIAGRLMVELQYLYVKRKEKVDGRKQRK